MSHVIPMTAVHGMAEKNFRQARRRAAVERVQARLTGRSAKLLCYRAVSDAVRAEFGHTLGLKEIPLDGIVGSVERCSDFSRSFLPLKDSTEQRWASIWEARAGELPPIRVNQIGETYFVVDGHHRVSVARLCGLRRMVAHVSEARARVPLTPDTQPDELALKAEYAGFLENTRLDEIRPDADLGVTLQGGYPILEQQIEVLRASVGRNEKREIGYEEAVGRWYDEVYVPTVRAMREREMLRSFPGRTETDLYLWVHGHSAALKGRWAGKLSLTRSPLR